MHRRKTLPNNSLTLHGALPWLPKRLNSCRAPHRGPTEACCGSVLSLPPGDGSRLLALLLRHQKKRHTLTQVHAQMVTTGLSWLLIGEPGLRLWNALLRPYALGDFPEEALLLYKEMSLSGGGSGLPGDTFTFAFLVKACANLLRVGRGMQVHGVTVKNGLESNVYVQTALLNMYCECGFIKDAQQIFDRMLKKNIVTWNAMMSGLMKWGKVDKARMLFDLMRDRNVISWTCMIDGLTRADRFREALLFFCNMMGDGPYPTEITILAVVPAVSNLGALDIAESLHAFCQKKGFSMNDVRVRNCLIDMYAKCGSINGSLNIFQEMANDRNLVTWTSMISAFAMHGMAKEVVELLERMGRENIKPNNVTFLSMLSACSHRGLVEEGLMIFSKMVHVHGIEPEMKHYGCMIDMMGRAGRLEEAEKMVLEMPGDVNVVVWRTLLNCCAMHGNAEIGERVMTKILELERRFGGDYVTLSNIFYVTGRFQDAEGIRNLMDERNVSKIPGRSTI